MNKTLLALLVLSFLLVVSLSIKSFTHDFNSYLKNFNHHAKINHNHRLNANKLDAIYTQQEQNFMDTFQDKFTKYLYGNQEVLNELTNRNSTLSYQQACFNVLIKYKDFPKFVELSLRNQPQYRWPIRMSDNLQIKFGNIVISQMNKTKSYSKLTSQQRQSIILSVLQDKQLAGYYATYNIDFNMESLTSQNEFPQLQSKYPVLKNIDINNITVSDKILILKTLVSDNVYWNQMQSKKNQQ